MRTRCGFLFLAGARPISFLLHKISWVEPSDSYYNRRALTVSFATDMAISAAHPGVIEVTKLAQDPVQLRSLRAHLEEVVHGKSFGTSPRGQQFLRHVMEKAIAGDLESLKERVIGIELFRRSASYNKSEDAIVRVTASDVRKRLLQHYKEHENRSPYQIDMPPGSYIPEIRWVQTNVFPSAVIPDASPMLDAIKLLPVKPVKSASFTSLSVTTRTLFAIPLVIALLALTAWTSYRAGAFKFDTLGPYRAILPWSSIFGSRQELEIITSDPDFSTEQDITRHTISLSDYANGKYLPDNPKLPPEVRNFCLRYLRGTRAADVDLPTVANIVTLAHPAGKKVLIRSARHMRTDDFQSDNDFILLGSPVADPWLEIFEQQLDFRFIYTDESTLQSIENVHPQSNELKLYVPQGKDFGVTPPTGVAYAVIAFLQNPHRSGHVLILAGTGVEGTWAASQLVLNTTDLADALNHCDHSFNAPLRNFEILLKVNIMAGSPTSTDIIACHRLPAT